MSKSCPPLRKGIDIDKPRWNQDTYAGRAKHFFTVTNPFNLFTSAKELERCKEVIANYKAGKPLPGCITENELWRCKQLYDSAYHPETGEKMPLLGRMSASVPVNTFVSAGMMTYYKTTTGVLFWQWLNQSLMALFNYTNRSGAATISDKQLMTSYVAATTGAVATALSLNHFAKKATPLCARFVPFAAVAAANMVNIPIMRAHELKNGIQIKNDKDVPLGYSKIAAQKAIAATVFSRIALAFPPLAAVAFGMQYYEDRGTFCRYPWTRVPVACAISAVMFAVATPLALALFRQRSEMPVRQLETELQDKISKFKDPPKKVYYNKGL